MFRLYEAQGNQSHSASIKYCRDTITIRKMKLFRQVILLQKDCLSDVSCVILYARKSVLIYLQFGYYQQRRSLSALRKMCRNLSEAVY